MPKADILYKKFLKRIVDFSVSIVGTIALLPVFAILIPLVAIANRGPVFFTQIRPGKNCKYFKVVKLKTMNDRRDATGKLLPDNIRMTAIGRILRATSLDELPQLWNVLVGNMSIVGPRPLLPEYVPLYTDWHLRRHEVRPGITGWAQINGRNSIAWEERFEMDIWYVDHLSFALDIKIILLTFTKVFKREGINSDNTTTMPKFTGYKA